MAYKVTRTKEESIEQLKALVSAFKKERAMFTTSKYNEAQLRNDFINPLLMTFGWDVENNEGKTQFLRDVIQEEPIDVEEDDKVTKKNPDYTLRIQGTRKFLLKLKKQC